ncbi:hypothetical protein Tco_0149761 [Tanacetum coccineum]
MANIRRVSTADDITMAKALVYIRKSAANDKSKGKMDESELEDIQARVEADEELAKRLQAEEREMYTEAKQARMLVELIYQIKRYFAAQRAEERRNKPSTQAQQRTYMSNYIKHIKGYTLQQLRDYSFDEIKNLFETTMRRVHTFVPIESEIERVIPELAARSSKRDAEEELDQENIDDELWKLQKHIHDLTWKLYDSCGVHHMSTEMGIYIYMLVEKEYLLSKGTLTQMLVAKLLVE